MLEEGGREKGGWNYAPTTDGERCVESGGTTVMLEWSAGSWALSQRQAVRRREGDEEGGLTGREGDDEGDEEKGEGDEGKGEEKVT